MDKFSLAFSVSNLGPKSFQKILNKYGTAEKGWKADEVGFKELGITGLTYKKFDECRKSFDIGSYVSKLNNEKVAFIAYTDKRYPKGLKKIENPPIGLFCKGKLSLLQSHSEPGFDPGEESKTKILRFAQDDRVLAIAVVGTRKVTEYGKSVTKSLVTELVQNGVCIVSGLALGVDAISHRTTVENNGYTIAVLGCGVDCCLPSENYSLYRSILEKNGLIVSEYPLGAPPNKGTFPARNRIIAALSDGVLVTEAAEDSGSLITADYALQFGKKVFAVPGPINSQMAKGSLKLLKNGAKLVTEAEDIFDELSIKNQVLRDNRKMKNLSLSNEEKKIVSLIENEGMTIDEISKKTKLPASKLYVSLSNLELKEVIKNSGGKFNLK